MSDDGCPPHDWRATGRREPHTTVALPKRQPKIAVFLRCATCGQNGFRYPPSPVIYTWRP